MFKRFLFLNNTNTEIWSKEKSMAPYGAKNILSPGKWGFLATLVSDTKISKLTLCF